MKPILSAVKKVSPEPGDIVLITCNKPPSRQDYDALRRHIETNRLKNTLFIWLDEEGDIRKLDEASMAKYGWVRGGKERGEVKE